MKNLDAWERLMEKDFRDDDLGCLVQAMRMLMWATLGMTLPQTIERVHCHLDHREPTTLDPVIAEYERMPPEPVRDALLRWWRRVRDGLAANPRVPPERELLIRYIRGELGDRTVRRILDLDSYELIAACGRHGFPPIQIGPEWEP